MVERVRSTSIEATESNDVGGSNRGTGVDRVKPAKVLAIVAADHHMNRADGIRDHTERLVEALRHEGTFQIRLALRRPGRGWIPRQGQPARSTGVPPDVLAADLVLVQYNPFWYGQRGFAPSLPAFLWNLRLRRRRPIIGLMIHETFVDARNFRWALMGAWQRAQLLALHAATDVNFCSIERWAELLGGMPPHRAAHHLPVGSNLPDMRDHREETRVELGVNEDTSVIACFGLRHPERLEDHTLRAARAIAQTGRRVLLLNLGQGPREVHAMGRVTVQSPGFLEAAALARLVAASDIFIAAHLDGVSTRRTTLMAALQHGIPVVGTSGRQTDQILSLARGALTLIPVDQPDAFGAAVAHLAGDPLARRRLGEAGRRLYTTEFDWPVIATRLLAGFGEAARGRDDSWARRRSNRSRRREKCAGPEVSGEKLRFPQ